MLNIAIVGSGPVGSFMAALCTHIGFRVTVYEKREEFTRKINLKIESGLFMKAHDVISRLNIKTEFFMMLDKYIKEHGNKIIIKELESMLTTEAKSQGAVYIIREVESFEEVYREHVITHNICPIILDCTGRQSKLRINEFGPDTENIITIPLQHAMYINFKAKVPDSIGSLYQAMKYIKYLKLSEVVVSKCRDADGFADVTLPAFITDELACIFDTEYPNINKEPLNPFNSPKPVPDKIFFPISSLLGNLIVDGCIINLDSVTVKKILITCGYARVRSRGKYVCLGDAAVHLAFFRSLNLGLKHALEFFIKLVEISGYRQIVKSDEVIRKFKELNPYLNPIKVYPTVARNVFLVVTKVIWYGCFIYNWTSHKSERLTNIFGVNGYEVGCILEQTNERLCKWRNVLAEFEAKRDEDIQNEIYSNCVKNTLYDYTSLYIDINGKSFIKISELARAGCGKYPLFKKDFEFLLVCFKTRREAIITCNDSFISTVSSLLNLLADKGFHHLKQVCADNDCSRDEKIKLIYETVNSAHLISMHRRDTNVSFVLALIRNDIDQFDISKLSVRVGRLPKHIMPFLKNIKMTKICKKF